MIQRVKAVVLVAQSLPELATLDFQACAIRDVTIPESVHHTVAFMRVWCLVRLHCSVVLLPFHRKLSARRTFGRVVCDSSVSKQVELMAAMNSQKPVVMYCGSAEQDTSSGNYEFTNDDAALERLM